MQNNNIDLNFNGKLYKTEAALKRAKTILNKSQLKQTKSENYKTKIGAEKLQAIITQRATTKELNKNFGLPLYTPDYAPSKPQIPQTEREKSKGNVLDVTQKRKRDKKALNGVFTQITLQPFEQMDKEVQSVIRICEKGSIIDTSIDELIKMYYSFNTSFLNNIISTEIIKKFNQFNKESSNDKFNLSVNLVINYIMIKDGSKHTAGDNGLIYKYYDYQTQGHYNFNLDNYYYNSKLAERIQSYNGIRDFTKIELIKFMNSIEQNINASNLVFYKIDEIVIQISKSKKTRAGCYIELPELLKYKRAIVNMKNKTDDKCLEWSLLSWRHYEDIKNKDRNNICYYKKYFNELIIPKDIKYPIDIQKDISKYEKLNNIKINVFYYEEKDTDFVNLKTLYNTSERNKDVCNLLLIKNETTEHLCWIKDLSKLKKMVYDEHKTFVCSQCIAAAYDTQEKLDKHLLLCMNHEATSCVMPKTGDEIKFNEKDKLEYKIKVCNKKIIKTEDKTKLEDLNKEIISLKSKLNNVDNKTFEDKNLIKFKNYNHTFKHPFSVFIDFEATLEDYDDDKHMNAYQRHKPNSCGIKFNCIHEQYSEPIKILNNSDDKQLLKDVIETIENYANKAYELTQQHVFFKYSNLTNEQKQKHNLLKICPDCKKTFVGDKKKVIHHNHITGEYISSICSDCNLNYKLKKFIPIYCHNLKNYDSHFLIVALSKYGYQNNDDDIISAIPNNEEKYISFSKKIEVDSFIKNEEKIIIKYELRFLDTFAFMASSLDNLVENLKKDSKDINSLRKIFNNVSEHYKNDEQFLLMISKGVYPYEYINNYDKLNDKQLPPIEKFYSRLSNEHIKKEKYEQAGKVWNIFSCNTLLDYHNLYLNSDVLLLADVWDNFRNTCYKIYGLDTNYYYTAPSLSWDALLKHCNENYIEKYNKEFYIELLTDIDMFQMNEKGIKGGLSQISKRYAKANNKYMTNYNNKLDDEYILYLDANNLYGYAMSSYLPRCNFKWNNEEWNTEKIMNLKDNDTTGYLFDVDLKYNFDDIEKTKELHDLHNGYPLAPENLSIKKEWLSEWQKKEYVENKTEKLITSFFDKTNYVINYRILKLYLSLGLELKCVNSCIEYEQDNFMESYILKNTNERAKCKNEFEKDFYKLMNNSVYGKTMENVRRRINFKLVNSDKKALSVRNKLIKFTIFDEDLIGLHLAKQEVTLNKPIFIGQCVLDQSKYLMYNFHYNKMLPYFGKENIDLLFTDTDSLCYHIKNKDPFEYMYENKNLFDLSDYPEDNKLHDKTNKKIIGKFKDESPNNVITEFCGLRSKLYAYSCNNDELTMKCKGVKKCVMKNLRLETYKTVLFNRTNETVKQTGFRSYNHNVYTELINKIAIVL